MKKKQDSDLLYKKLQNIKLLVFDSDGVLTDGGVYFLENGEQFRRFDIKDGMGLAQCLKAGYEIAIISGSPTESVRHRAMMLGIKHIFLGVADKLSFLEGLCQQLDFKLNQVMFMGDDLADLAVMQSAGFACCPADAEADIISAADYVCGHEGGHGAVRELCDLFLESKVSG